MPSSLQCLFCCVVVDFGQGWARFSQVVLRTFANFEPPPVPSNHQKLRRCACSATEIAILKRQSLLALQRTTTSSHSHSHTHTPAPAHSITFCDFATLRQLILTRIITIVTTLLLCARFIGDSQQSWNSTGNERKLTLEPGNWSCVAFSFPRHEN